MDKKKSFQALAEMDLSERRKALIDYFSKWADIGDSYIFDLTRVKEAFAIGTMGLEDFQEWDLERVEMLVDELLEAFPQEGPAFVWGGGGYPEEKIAPIRGGEGEPIRIQLDNKEG